MKKPLAIFASLTGVTGVLIVSAVLATGQSVVQSVDPSVPSEQQVALSDGVVTSEEYSTAYSSLAACVEEAGITITNPEINPIDGITYLFSVDVANVGIEKGEAAFADCRERYWSATAALYQGTAETHMDPKVRDLALSCVAERGLEVDKDARTPLEMNGEEKITNELGEDTERWGNVTDCLYDAVAQAYPDMQLAQVPTR